ncbi:MAG TPA: ligase-associated DNA damage response endonuclease PdeM [Cyclobacteriaceae bacterium]|jgi:DNA ligase-associated metallophosphoesterase|nr:ligase-associated DNA damage response endonuclease PdeM [Cyclobacteriaceae bacterium]
MDFTELNFGGERVHLLPEKALWLPNIKSLVIADVHWGKIDHFRKAGIPVPVKGNDKNAEVLISIINQFKPERVIFLGDLFHSVYNDGWETFGQIRKAFVHCSFELVIGNHDIMSNRQYERHNILLHEESLLLNDLLLTHEPLEEIPEGAFNVAGHVHPGAHLRGTGKQSVILPCFYFKNNQCILPAFGAFTGLATVQPKRGDKIFVVANGNVIAANES